MLQVMSILLVCLFLCSHLDLLPAIARNTHTFRSYFDDAANYDDFHDLLSIVIRNPYPHLVEVISDCLCRTLLELGEVRAEKWFRENWCGEKGRYMLAHCAVGVHGDILSQEKRR